MMKFLFLISTSLTLSSEITLAASCCSGSSFSAPIITGDEKSKFQTRMSRSTIAIQAVDSEGLWHQADSISTNESLKMDYSSLISDRWQIGTSLSAQQRSFNDTVYRGSGDIYLFTAYEYLHRYNYSSLVPNSFLYTGFSNPTSTSKFKSKNGGLDSFGHGTRTLYLGTLLSFPQRYLQYSFGAQLGQKSYDNNPWSRWLQLEVGLSHSIKKWNMGMGISNFSSQSIETEDSSGNKFIAGPEKYTDLSISIGYDIDNEQLVQISYVDQTILGTPLNTSLSKTISMQYTYRYSR